MKAKQIAAMAFTVFATAFLIALMISSCIAIAIGSDALPLIEIRNDLIFAAFIACVQLIWAGSDRNNRTYIIRTIVHFVILITGCTLLMLWFGWLPPGDYIFTYYAVFIVAYIVIWLIFWRVNKRKWSEMNRKLKEYQKDKLN